MNFRKYYVLAGLVFLGVGVGCSSTPSRKVSSVDEAVAPNPTQAYGRERFKVLLQRLKAGFKNDADVPTLAEGARRDLYYMQAIVRLYTNVGTDTPDSYPVLRDLEEINSSCKKLEDSLGAFSETSRVGSSADGIQRDILRRLRDERWIGSPSRFDEIDAKLKAIEWPTPQADRNMMLTRMGSHMENLNDRKFDMNHAEEGIHALRKEIRWFIYYTTVLGMVDTAAGKKPLVDNAADHCPYSGSPPDLDKMGGTGVCQISGCVYQKLVNSDRKLAQLKRDGADREHRHLPPLPETTAAAEAVWKSLRSENVLIHLANQVKACRNL